ncbi:MAG: chorismate synthase [Phycisphaerales bacterium]|nr:chorismate synthase [Phycisphaerales bacterium]
MPRLDYQTAGESHGPAMVVIVTGLPAGLALDLEFVNAELKRRQGGYGRGGRQRIEDDRAEVLAGLRRGRTIGSPLAIRIANKDSRLDDAARTPPVFRPRPGHADLAGAIKYLTPDCRDVLERASARETAARTAAGAVARVMLREFGIEAFGFTRSIGEAATEIAVGPDTWMALRTVRDASGTFCPDAAATERQCGVIRGAKVGRDTVGGVVEAHVFGCPPGLGSCMDWRDRLDSRLAGAVMGVQAIKAVEIGMGLGVAARAGSRVHDPIGFDPAAAGSGTLGYLRGSNHAGGIEGGMTNGQPVVVRGAMKPISTLAAGLPSVDLKTGQAERSDYERSDVCAVPACSVVVENVTAFEIGRALCDKFPSDTLREMRPAYDRYLALARGLPLEPPERTIA